MGPRARCRHTRHRRRHAYRGDEALAREDFRVFPQDRFATYLKGALLRKTAEEKASLLAQAPVALPEEEPGAEAEADETSEGATLGAARTAPTVAPETKRRGRKPKKPAV